MVNFERLPPLKDEKENLLKIIEWYRDEYCCGNAAYYHGVMEAVEACETWEEFDMLQQVVDGWLF